MTTASLSLSDIPMAWRIENYYYYAVPYGSLWEVRRLLDPESPDEYDSALVHDCDSEDPDDAIHLAITRCDWGPPVRRTRPAISPTSEAPAA